MLQRILKLDFIPSSKDAGLLVLRVALCTSLFLKHGSEKIFNFSQMATHFPDPLHIGASTGLVFAMIGDSICSLLIVVGFATRWASLIAFTNIFIAWALVHHFLFFGHDADHGEIIVLYLAGLLNLFVAGAGKYSVDSLLNK
jgi:putative oxidoreductase